MTDDDAAETAIIVPAPSIPLSQSDAAQQLQVIEARMGSVLDQVVQSPRRSGNSAASAVRRTRRQRPIRKQYTCKPSSPLFHFIATYSYYTVCRVAVSGVPPFAPESVSGDSFSLLLQLDEIKDPGISEEEFNELFLKCRKCGWHMTRRATVFHKCAAVSQDHAMPVEVIDLTNDV
jgi:hypothetical protein